MPSYQKQPIETILDNQEVQTSMTKVTKFISGLVNGVEVKAGWCEHQMKLSVEWWRIWVHLNQCSIETVNLFSDVTAGVIGLLGASPCSWACGIIALIIQMQKAVMNWFNSRCGGDGVAFNRTHNGIIYWWAVC
jgi:hypothetical protein